MGDLVGFCISRAFGLNLDNLNRNTSVYASKVILSLAYNCLYLWNRVVAGPTSTLGSWQFYSSHGNLPCWCTCFSFWRYILTFWGRNIDCHAGHAGKGVLLLMSIHGSYNTQTRFITVLVILEMPTVGWDLTEIGCHLHFEHMSFWDSCYNDS